MSPTPLRTPSPSPPPSLCQLQLTEATNARTPEPELLAPAAAEAPAAPSMEFATVQALDVDVMAECRPAMSEVHSEDNRGDVPAEAEEAEPEAGVVAVAPAGAGLGAAPGLFLPDLPDRPCSALSDRAEIKLVEEEIAAVLSGETEVLKEHNVLGCVAFNFTHFLLLSILPLPPSSSSSSLVALVLSPFNRFHVIASISTGSSPSRASACPATSCARLTRR